MFDSLINIIAPYYCYSCHITGPILCKSCIYNISSESQNVCFGCQIPSLSGICVSCSAKLPFSHTYVVGERKKELESLLNDFKFNRSYKIHAALAQLLHNSLPYLPENTIVVPVPTITKHIRIRGYDHTDLIARTFAHHRKLKKVRLLKRKTNSVQLGASAHLRRQQANLAYKCTHQLNANPSYLLIDDIATTGATLIAAANCLKKAGAKTIIAAFIARQTLKSTSR